MPVTNEGAVESGARRAELGTASPTPAILKRFLDKGNAFFYSSGPVIVEYLSRHSAMERRMAKTANQRRPFSKPAKKS